jgi:hypothetical protein
MLTKEKISKIFNFLFFCKKIKLKNKHKNFMENANLFFKNFLKIENFFSRSTVFLAIGWSF